MIKESFFADYSRLPWAECWAGDARIRLLDAARHVIRAKGFAATSVDELCRVAGVG